MSARRDAGRGRPETERAAAAGRRRADGSERFDVVVAGGGLTGLVAAVSLARAGFEVAVVEGRARAARDDGRVSALTVASERILGRLGVWERLDGLAPFHGIEVWEAPDGPQIRFDAEDAGAAHLGHIAANETVAAALESAGEALGVVWRRPARMVGMAPAGRGEAAVELEGARLTARLVVGADGSDSTVRRLAGIEAHCRDYGQLGIVCSVRPERDHGGIARQVFHPAGPLAFLPLPEGLCSIVWSTERAHAERLLVLSAAAFERALEEAFERRLGSILWSGPRAGFPLRSIRAAAYRGPRTALVGDAAHTIHPLAGQGVNLGILDAAALAEAAAGAARRGRDPGGRAALERYERMRKTHNLAAGWTMDGFDRLFRHPGAAVRALRSAGLAAVDRVGPLKNAIARRASGLAGDLPAAAAPRR